MQELFEEIKSDFWGIIQNTLIPKIEQEAKKEFGDINYLNDRLESIRQLPYQKENELQSHEIIEKSIQQIELNKEEAYSGRNLFEFCPAFFEQSKQFIENLPEKFIATQKKERYQFLKEDSSFLKFKKGFKIFGWRVSGVKYLLSKNKNPFRKHPVPVRDIAQYYFLAVFIEKLKEIQFDVYPPIMSGYLALKNNQTDEIKKQETILSDKITVIKDEITTLFENTFSSFEKSCEKVNTVELGSRKFKTKTSTKKIEETNKKWKKLDKEWGNTYQTIIEGWKSEQEVEWLISKSKNGFDSFLNYQDEKLNAILTADFEEIQTFINTKKNEIETLEDNEKLSLILKKTNYEALKKIDQEIIPKLSNNIANHGFVKSVQKLETELSKDISKLSTERKLPNIQTDYLSPISDEDIINVSAYEIINFEILSKLEKSLTHSKENLKTNTEDYHNKVKGLGRMIIFGLESVIDFLKNEPTEHDKAKQMFIDSLERSSNRLTELENSINETINESQKEIKIAVEQYISKLDELSEQENVKEIRLRVLKAKTLRQTEEYKKSIENSAVSVFSKVKNFVINKYNAAKTWVEKLKQKYALTEDKPDLKKESTNYLISSLNKINKLPVIYRNIYKISPLNEMELFVSREAEYQNLINAYKNWSNGKKGAISIISEKWNGTSSFLNFAIKNSTFDNALIRKDIAHTIPDKISFWKLFAEILQDKTLHSKEKIIEFLNEGPKRVIILENIHRIYLRKIDGFENLNMLLEIISRTNKNILWIVTSTIYSWEYLNLTLKISNYFNSLITLSSFKKDELKAAIEKRNQISGYKIVFEPTEEQTKNFHKLNEEEIANKLQTIFFNSLFNYSNGNIGLAQVYWLLSTKQVNEDRIKIQLPSEPNYNFLNTLGQTEIFILNMLTIHGGLTESQIFQTLHIPQKTILSSLNILEEDAIIQKSENGKFTVSLMIYSKITQLLKQKNFI